jgi:hypothetical protein
MIERPEIDIVIPFQRHSAQLDASLSLLEENTENYRLNLVEEPSLNVSEARQQAMDSVVRNRFVCFLDDDSEMIQSGWLEHLYEAMVSNDDAGAIFGGEWWGTEERTQIVPVDDDEEIGFGPAACMLLDRERLPEPIRWDTHIGLRNGWLGGDFEEVDYCYRLRNAGFRLLRATKSLFHHTGGRTTRDDFARTDRCRGIHVMRMLLRYKYLKAPEDEDWFKGPQYVPASPRNDCMLASGRTLRECYADVIRRNGLSYVRAFHRMGLV